MRIAPNKIHILIADDHELFIDGLVMLLKDVSDICVDEVVNDGKELLDILRNLLPDIILLDINMPKMNGMDAVRYIRQYCRSVKIIMLSSYDEEYMIKKARELGANGYLVKNCAKNELLRSIRLVYGGTDSFPLTQQHASEEFNDKDDFLKQFKLTLREMEIVRLIKINYSNQQIAEKLSLSIYTIETHRKNIMQKLGFKKPAELIRFIFEKGL